MSKAVLSVTVPLLVLVATRLPCPFSRLPQPLIYDIAISSPCQTDLGGGVVHLFPLCLSTYHVLAISSHPNLRVDSIPLPSFTVSYPV